MASTSSAVAGRPNSIWSAKAAKPWAIAQAVVEAGPDATVLYADESRSALLPLLRALWHGVGQQVRIPTPGSNVSRALFGALNIRSGRWVYLVRPHMRKEDFIVFLEHRKIAADRLYCSMKVLLEAVERFEQDMTPQQALIWAA